MLIELVDLAAANLKKKGNQITIDAMDRVVDFVNHAVSLFEPIAYRIYIRRVTYGGNLSRSVLEQMYAAHASSFFLEKSGRDGRFLQTQQQLQFLFHINDKKAKRLTIQHVEKSKEGIMQLRMPQIGSAKSR
jgi:hypothetical protein